jgi:hypothetical protein
MIMSIIVAPYTPGNWFKELAEKPIIESNKPAKWIHPYLQKSL